MTRIIGGITAYRKQNKQAFERVNKNPYQVNKKYLQNDFLEE